MCDEDGAIHLQSDTDLIYKWSVQKHLSFNVRKCKFMIFFSNMRKNSTSPNPPTLKLGDHVLETVHQFKYLGVLLSDDLR